MAANSMEKPMKPEQPLITPANAGLGEPDIEIEIEDPEKVSIIAGDMQIEIDPDAEDPNEFNVNLAEEMDDTELSVIAEDLLGDFNEEPNGMNIQSLKAVGLKSLMEPMIGKPKIGTYVYRGKDELVDQIIIHESLEDQSGLIIDPESIYILDLPKYRQQEGRYAHYPFRFWAGDQVLGGYSDHLAIRVAIIKK